ncbi:hypothetical protein AAJP84_03505 [Bartonella schoenbuchensis]|nr:hypothetical protein [Bartonella capreoli]
MIECKNRFIDLTKTNKQYLTLIIDLVKLLSDIKEVYFPRLAMAALLFALILLELAKTFETGPYRP